MANEAPRAPQAGFSRGADTRKEHHSPRSKSTYLRGGGIFVPSPGPLVRGTKGKASAGDGGDYDGLSLSLVGWWTSRRCKHATTMPTIKTFDFYRKIPLDLTETTLQGAVMSGCAL